MPKPAKGKGFGRGRHSSPTPESGSAKARQHSGQLYEAIPELHLIYDTAPIGLAFLTPDCRYVRINQRLTEICGISAVDHIGRSVRETVPQVADQVENIIRSVTHSGAPVTGIEVRGQRPDGLNADRVWTTSWHPWKNSDGRVVGVNVVAEDITERKRAEEALAASEKAVRESEGRFRELADNISQFAWTADRTGWRYWYNKRWHDYTGTRLEEMQGWGWRKVHHPDHVDRVVAGIRQSFENGTPWEDTFPLRGRDGDYRWFLSRALPIRNDGGEVIRWLGTNTDITEQIEAEQALRQSEARFRELADNISQFAWTADRSGWIYWYNKRWHDYTGTMLEEMQGWGWQKVHHPDYVDRVVARIRQSFENGTPWEDTFPLRGRDGNYRWFLSRALPIHNDTGEVVRWFGTNTDITEEIEAERALRELNDNLEQRVQAETRERLQIWNVSEDLLVVADMEGKYLNVNPAWTATLGWSESDLLGRSSEWLLHPDDRGKTSAEIGQLAAGRKTSRFESRLRHKHGSYHWISWKAAPDRGRIYAMGRDITELKYAENELRETRRELAEVAGRATLAAMTAAIAHEIKQPLGAIVTNANAGLRWLDRSAPDVAEAGNALRRIAADAHRASDVIQSVKEMFATNERANTLLDPNELIKESIAFVSAELEQAKIAVQLELAEGLPLISAHRGQLQQVMLNLVTNAVDAMRHIDNRTRLLRVKCEAPESSGIAISVQDSGTGINQNDIDRIFDAFFTTKKNGMGMGLAICRLIVESHSGTLSVMPGISEGSVFQIILPAYLSGTR
jgi:PAS domain S-box-containing protein